MSLRAHLLFEISRRMQPEPAIRTVDYEAYQAWRRDSLTTSWKVFDKVDLTGLDVLDFGCGDGALGLFLATKGPSSVVGVDLSAVAIERARAALARTPLPGAVQVRFLEGSVDGMPVPAASFDVLVAFDCLEHVMSPLPILREWRRVLRPGGRCLLEWFPYKGPWGPHMESLIPVPWAHVLFGQQAMFRAAERIYDLPSFRPRHWDLDERGDKRPNKWKQWSRFAEQGYINELDVPGFRRFARDAGLDVVRFESRSFGGSGLRRGLGRWLMGLPMIGEYFMSHAVIELRRPVADDSGACVDA